MEEVKVPGYKKVVKFTGKKTGITGIVCIHNDALGPALGGTRIYPYATFEEALFDVTRLAQGMTYKSSIHGSGLGGGKSVIIASPEQKSPELFEEFASVLNFLEGEYTAAEDMNCSPEDMGILSQFTPYVVGVKHAQSSGNPSPFTVWGVLRGIESALQHTRKSTDLEGLVVAVQGLGSVGMRLAELLFWRGARLIVSDKDSAKVEYCMKNYAAQKSSVAEIFSVKCDIFSPCAMGGILNPTTIPYLQCKIVAGAANNQLLQDEDSTLLAEKGILYVPDFVINGGGLINVTQELEVEGYNPQLARNKVHAIYDELLSIFAKAEALGKSTHEIALQIANERVKKGEGKRVHPPVYHHYAKSHANA